MAGVKDTRQKKGYIVSSYAIAIWARDDETVRFKQIFWVDNAGKRGMELQERYNKPI